MASCSCITTEYFSGQGAVLLAERVAGAPTGFTAVGNVSALAISVEREVFEHKESCSGSRAIDLEITTEINSTVSMTVEHFSKENLALALFGTSASVMGSTVMDEGITARHDKAVALARIKVSAVTVTDSTGMTTYTLDTDYTLCAEFGTITALSTGAITDAQALLVDYTFATQETVDALTASAPERWMRFEGLNTASSNKEVLIDIFRFQGAPLAELAMIGDEITQMEVEGKALVDAFQTGGGSQVFRITKVV